MLWACILLPQLALETLLAVLHEPGGEAAAPVERVIATELVVRESAVGVGS